MNLTRKKTESPIIKNAESYQVFIDGVHKQYEICPCEGFKLHDARLDREVIDDETLEPTGEIMEGFKRGSVTVRHDYDFENVMDGEYNGEKVIKAGKYGFFTVKDEEE